MNLDTGNPEVAIYIASCMLYHVYAADGDPIVTSSQKRGSYAMIDAQQRRASTQCAQSYEAM